MAPKIEETSSKSKTTSKAPKDSKEFVLRDDYSPLKKGEKISLTKEGEKVLKSQNLI